MGTGANTLHDSLMHMSMYFSLLRCFLLKQSEHAQLKVARVLFILQEPVVYSFAAN